MLDSRKILAFDVGEKRIGVAVAQVPPRVSMPLTTLLRDATLEARLKQLIADHLPDMLVVGRPRNQSGAVTKQTAAVEAWVESDLTRWDIPIYWQDESLTSVSAEAHLESTKKNYTKADIDAHAAAIILTDFLEDSEL